MKKRFLQETNWSVFLVLLAALFLIVNYLGYRHYHRWDLTADKTFTLSPQTEKVLDGLKKPLDVVVFLAPTDELYGRVKELLSSYAAASPEVKVEYIDPDRDRARMQLLAKKYNVSVANVVVFDSGGRSKYVEKDQMVDYDFSAMQHGGRPTIKDFKAEQAFTNAILDVLNPKKPVVYFTSGHGERTSAGKGSGIGLFKDRLTKEGDVLHDWDSLGKASVPADADLLVVAGPTQPFLPAEAQVIETYLEKGGRALFLMDPELLPGRPPSIGRSGLEDVLKTWGVTPDADVVLDPKVSVPNLGAQTFFAASYGRSPIVSDLSRNRFPILFSLAQSLTVGRPANKAYRDESLLMTSPASWGKKNLANVEKNAEWSEGDPRGPLTLAASVSSDKKEDKTRIVVVGDADVASDALVQSGSGNLLFCLNCVHWLLHQESRLAIPPRTEVKTHLALSASQTNLIFIIFVVLMPCLVAGAGIYVYLQRRR